MYVFSLVKFNKDYFWILIKNYLSKEQMNESTDQKRIHRTSHYENDFNDIEDFHFTVSYLVACIF